MPIRAIAKELIARGFEVTFVTGSSYTKIIEDIGATHVPLEGYCDFTEKDADARFPVCSPCAMFRSVLLISSRNAP